MTLIFSRTDRRRPRISFASAFPAHINRFGRGLFVVDYPTGEGRKRMISSHLEPADARRIFPGWDEPAFKATLRAHGDGAGKLPGGFQYAGRARRAERRRAASG